MAAVEYVLSHPLCFLLKKFGKVQNKLLKNALLDFYSPDALSAAKRQLLKDIEKVKDVSFPHIPQQRQGENKGSREIDDMFTILTVLDEAENVSVSVLPTYVADNTDNIPSLRIYEGDMGVFVTMLEKLEAKFCLMEAAISNIAQDLHNIRTRVNACQLGNKLVTDGRHLSADICWPTRVGQHFHVTRPTFVGRLLSTDRCWPTNVGRLTAKCRPTRVGQQMSDDKCRYV